MEKEKNKTDKKCKYAMLAVDHDVHKKIRALAFYTDRTIGKTVSDIVDEALAKLGK